MLSFISLSACGWYLLLSTLSLFFLFIFSPIDNGRCGDKSGFGGNLLQPGYVEEIESMN